MFVFRYINPNTQKFEEQTIDNSVLNISEYLINFRNTYLYNHGNDIDFGKIWLKIDNQYYLIGLED